MSIDNEQYDAIINTQPTDKDMYQATDEWYRMRKADDVIMKIQEHLKDTGMDWEETCFAIEVTIDNYLNDKK